MRQVRREKPKNKNFTNLYFHLSHHNIKGMAIGGRVPRARQYDWRGASAYFELSTGRGIGSRPNRAILKPPRNLIDLVIMSQQAQLS